MCNSGRHFYIAILNVSAPIGSYLANRYSYRTSSFIGGLVAALAISIGYFSTGIEFLFISHGVLTGIFYSVMFETNCV